MRSRARTRQFFRMVMICLFLSMVSTLETQFPEHYPRIEALQTPQRFDGLG